MKVDSKKAKRYFDVGKDESNNKPTTPKKQRKSTDKHRKSKDEVQVFNVKITPRLLNIQKYKKLNKVGKPIRDKKKKKRFPGKAPLDPKKLEQHSRGEGIGKGVRHPLHLEKLKKKEKKINFAQEQAARAEILLTEDHGGLEIEGEDIRTTAISQKIIAENVDIAAATKIFELNLDFGPYRAKYTRNGRHLLLGSNRGHLAAFDWVTKKLHCEINVMESIHDISWLHVETMFAAAQKEWLYIYDNTGTELHCVKRMNHVLRMEFLPYHFLLATVNEHGFLSWLDVSIGEIVGHYNNKLGRSAVMTQNPYNGTLCVGDSKGVVSLWAPTVKEPLAKILCHKSPVTSVAVDNTGLYMATSGVERSLKVWDVRRLDGPLQHYRLRAAPRHLHFSQRGLLAVALGDTVEVYNDCCTKTAEGPYLRHRMAKSITNFQFCPYEDVLGIGTDKGFSSIIVPGSGEPNFDALEANPFQTKSQRKEAEVKALLEKVPVELITLNPFEVTEVDVPSMQQLMEAKKKLLYLKPKKINMKPRNKNKGQNRIVRQKIIKETARKDYIQDSIEAQKQLNIAPERKEAKQSFGVLDRFVANPKPRKK